MSIDDRKVSSFRLIQSLFDRGDMEVEHNIMVNVLIRCKFKSLSLSYIDVILFNLMGKNTHPHVETLKVYIIFNQIKLLKNLMMTI